MFNEHEIKPEICVVGHPYAPIGMGEHARSVFRAMTKAGMKPGIVDIYGLITEPDISFRKGIEDSVVNSLSDGINVFCINGDEVEGCSRHLKDRGLGRGYNIIYPAWELEKYPSKWAKWLNWFDEIWAPSQFIKRAIEPTVTKPVFHMPLACEIGNMALATRRNYGIPESSYAFFFAFDFLSYMERKNPGAVIEAFRNLCDRYPQADVVLVVKTNNGGRNEKKHKELKSMVAQIRNRVVLIDKTLPDADMKALMYLCDCFVSLHRSEGFGRGLTEAMRLGKPVIATDYSGNMDYCTAETSFLVGHQLVDLKPGSYPHWEGQVWAEPSVSQTVDIMEMLVKRPGLGITKGQKARVEMMRGYSYLAIGMNYKNRITKLLGESASSKEVAGEYSSCIVGG